MSMLQASMLLTTKKDFLDFFHKLKKKGFFTIIN
jgi:hypothetical protein